MAKSTIAKGRKEVELSLRKALFVSEKKMWEALYLLKGRSDYESLERLAARLAATMMMAKAKSRRRK